MAAQLVLLVLAHDLHAAAIVRVLAPGFADNPGQFALTVRLARITFPYLILTVVAVQLSAMLNAIEKFWAAAAWSNLLEPGDDRDAAGLALVSQRRLCRRLGRAARAAWRSCSSCSGRARAKACGCDLSWPRWTPEIKEFFMALRRGDHRRRPAW